MNLPTQNQVNTAGRYTLAVVSGIVGVLGLQAKGINMDQVKIIISSLGDLVNNLVILITAAGVAYASIKGTLSASPAAQAEALTKQAPGTVVVTTPEIAAATPNAPNVISNTETQATVTQTVKEAKESV